MRRDGAMKGFAGFVAATVTMAVLLGGCGGDEPAASDASASKVTVDRAAVRQVMSDLQTASRAGDGKRICTQIFTPKLADSVTTSAASGSCAREVRHKLFSRRAGLAVQSIIVSDPVNATATVKEASGNTSTVFLVKQSGRWRIRSVQAA